MDNVDSIPRCFHRGAPRFEVNNVLGGLYRVKGVKRNGRKQQLLFVVSVVQQHSSNTHIAKVVSRPPTNTQKLEDHIAWLKSDIVPDSKSHLIFDFRDNDFVYLIFHRNHYNLKIVMYSGHWKPLSSVLVKDIGLQILQAVRFLHREVKTHGDICPEHIEFLDSFCSTEESYNEQTEQYETETIITSTNIRLAFYGDLEIAQHLNGTDQYRAPEVVFGGKSTPESDRFSVGCILGEMAVLYDAISGRFPEGLAITIEEAFPGTFDDLEIRPKCPDTISGTCRQFYKTFRGWQDLFDDRDLIEVLVNLVHTNPQMRESLDAIACFEYFRYTNDDID
ncbi:hypothetical protein D9619_012691 [Psilocybe cf. subviscida]|uniref:Protein kinase domain-containing protein n=1 Tax=Psilocybe cf. subviscida TaxID=2480587 RepID=A0A8H5ER27_9AGAR|nr:hypothetical protein D9619_012691 [Psilocybe cf. subviscida]